MASATETASFESSGAQFLEELRKKNREFYGTDRGQGALKDL